MKNLYLFLLLLIAASGFAQTPKKAGKADTAKSATQRDLGDVYISPAVFYGTLSVNFKNVPNKDIKILVKDMSDKVVFEEVYPQLKSKGFKLDLSALKKGKYNLIVADKENNVLNKTEIESK